MGIGRDRTPGVQGIGMSYLQKIDSLPEPTDCIRTRMRARTYPRETTIYLEGDAGGGLFYVNEGVVECQVASVIGEVTIANLFWPGSWLGESALLTGEPHYRTFIARTNLSLDFIPRAEIQLLLRDRPTLWREIGKMAATHHRLAMRAYLDAAIKNPVQRCLATLVRLAGFGLAPPRTDLARTIPISQSEFGDMVALCRNTVAKELSRLAEAGLVTPHYRKIFIPSIWRAIDAQDKFDE